MFGIYIAGKCLCLARGPGHAYRSIYLVKGEFDAQKALTAQRFQQVR